VAINWNGISFQDEKEKKLLELPYPEVTGVNKSRYEQAIPRPCLHISEMHPSFLLPFEVITDLNWLVLR
jgi:hypothetical protein